MNWKQIIITSLITLTITITSGIAVNWYTKNKIENKKDKNQLYYNIVDISEFKSDSTKISFVTLEVFNYSSENYKNVLLSINLDENPKIIDLVSKNSRNGNTYNPKIEKNKIIYSYPLLYSKEVIKTNLALQNFDGKLKINLQSDETVGLLYNSIEKEETDKSPLLKIVLLSIVLLVLIFILFTKIRGSSLSNSNVNNTAFLFLHNKLFQNSRSFIYNKIKKDGGTSYELSNLATTEYFISTNNLNKAKSLLRMADYISYSKNEKFIVAFNNLIIYANEKNYVKVRENLEICNKLRPKELNKYIKFSLIMKEIMDNDPIITDYINNLKS